MSKMLFKDYAALEAKKKYFIQLGTLSLSASVVDYLWID